MKWNAKVKKFETKSSGAVKPYYISIGINGQVLIGGINNKAYVFVEADQSWKDIGGNEKNGEISHSRANRLVFITPDGKLFR